MKLPFARKPQPTPSLTAVEVPQSSFSYRTSLTPDYVISARNQLKSGFLSPMLAAFRIFQEEDDTVASAISVRSEALKTASVSFNTQNLSQPQVDYFSFVAKRFTPLLTDMLLELKLTGALFRQIQYELDAGLYYPSAYLEYPNVDLRIIDGKPVPHHATKPITINPLQFICLAQPKPILYSVIKYNVFFSFALNNWAQFTETYGKPPRIAKYKPGTTQAEKDQLWNMLQNFGTDLAAMVSDNVVIDFADFSAKSVSADLYHNLAKFCDQHITRRILGNTLTTTAVGDGGSYAQAKVHQLVREDILAGDCRDLDAFLTDHFNMLNTINFGVGEIDVSVTPAQDINLVDRIQVDTKLFNEVGIDFPEDYWHRTYNVPMPERS